MTFYQCKKLQAIDFQENSQLTTIQKDAFFESTISSLSIPSKCINLEEGWCKSTPLLTNIKIDENNPRYKMYENTYISDDDRTRGYIIRNIKYSAKRRGLEFNLNYKDLELPKYCPILGIELSYGIINNYNEPNHATVDRIDNNKGYVKGNVIIVSRLANAMKNCATFEQLNLFADRIKILINYYKTHGAIGCIADVFNENIEHFSNPSR